jgi:hypothetical protein
MNTDEYTYDKKPDYYDDFIQLVYWYNKRYTVFNYYDQKQKLFEIADNNIKEVYPLLLKLYNRTEIKNVFDGTTNKYEIKIMRLLNIDDIQNM